MKKDKLLQELENNAAKLSAIGKMTTRIAHEMNNPLMIIQGCVDFIQKSIVRKDLDPAKLEKYTYRMTENINRMSQIITSLQSFSREGKQDRLQIHSMLTIIEESLAICKTQFNLSDFKIEIIDRKSITQLPEVYCRYTELVDSVFHIISNSVIAIQKMEQPWIRITVECINNIIKITFTDSGDGINPEIAHKIMEPFFTTRPIGAGLGLGLTFSNNIIESHKGKLYLNINSPNTEFIMELPHASFFAKPT